MRAQLRLIASYLAAITGEITKIRKLAEDQFEQSLRVESAKTTAKLDRERQNAQAVRSTLLDSPTVTRHKINVHHDQRVQMATIIVTRVDGSSVQIEFDRDRLGDLDFSWCHTQSESGKRAWQLWVEQR